MALFSERATSKDATTEQSEKNNSSSNHTTANSQISPVITSASHAFTQAATDLLNNTSNGDFTLGTVRHQLNLRLDRPIEGCELRPRAYVYSTQRTSTGLANKAYNQCDHTFEFRWYRGPERQACANPACPRADSFSAMEWSTYALQGSRIQCIVCSRLKVPRHKTIFCNAKCFKEAWKVHQAIHKNVPPAVSALGTGAAAGSGLGLGMGIGMSLGQPVRPMSPTTLAGQALAASTPGGATAHSFANPASQKADPLHDDDSDDEWELISTEPLIVPSSKDVGHCLRLECKAVLPEKTLVCTPKIITTEPVLCLPPLPAKRPLITTSKGPSSAGGGGSRFRIVSYNLLAEIYATQQAYPNCDFWALSWNYRKSNLVRELMEAGADILCLQEVQADAYQNFFQPVLAEKGFDGLYKSKTRESMGMIGKVDGCAIFWRRTRFRLIENYAVEFNECARRTAQAMGLSAEEGNAYLHRLSKDNIALVAVLEFLQRPRAGRMPTAPQICIANTHLYSNPDFPDVKLWQSHALLQEVEHFVVNRQLPLMVCGDFNSEPHSAVYELVSTQQVSRDHPDLQSDPTHVLPDASDLTHGIQLQSAYAHMCGEEPAYTNYTDQFKGTLDYIWFTVMHLRPLAIVAVPTPDEIKKCGTACPNVSASSDHILLCADMQLGGTLSSPVFQGQPHKYYSKN